MVSEESCQRLINGLRAGDSHIEYEFWESYSPALQQVAERYLSPQLQARFGSDDVVQSACRTFMRRVRGGEFQVDDSRALWRVLVVITVNKVRERARFHRRRKRSVDQEIRLSGAASDEPRDLDPVDYQDDPGDAAAFAEQMERLLAGFDEEERLIVLLKLQDLTNDAVAQKLDLSERTVRRKLKLIQARLSRALAQSQQ